MRRSALRAPTTFKGLSHTRLLQESTSEEMNERGIGILKHELREAWDKIPHSNKEKSDIKFERLCKELKICTSKSEMRRLELTWEAKYLNLKTQVEVKMQLLRGCCNDKRITKAQIANRLKSFARRLMVSSTVGSAPGC